MEPSNMALVPVQPAAQPIAQTESNKQTGQISQVNKEILGKYAGHIYTKHLTPSHLIKTEKSGFWMTISSWLPTAYTVGSNVGWAIALTHGGDTSNWVVSKIAHKVLPPPAAKSSGWEGFKNRLLGIEERSVEEAAKLLLTPKILPILTSVCTSGGGITMMAAAALAGVLYNRLIGTPGTKYTLDTLPDLDSLLKVNEEGKIVDANGTEMTLRDLKDICLTINRYDLTCKLMTAKKEEIEGIFNSYLKDRVSYLDGSEIDAKDREIIAIAKDRLMGNNPMNYAEDIVNSINLLADHVPAMKMSLEDIRQHMDKVKAGVNLLEEAPKVTLLIEEMPKDFKEEYQGHMRALELNIPRIVVTEPQDPQALELKPPSS